MSPYSLYENLNGAGFPITYQEAQDLFNRYCANFETGVEYIRANGVIAAKQGYLTNLNGRRRYWMLPDPRDAEKFPRGLKDPAYRKQISGIQRQAGNFLIQSVNADITKYGMVMLRDYIKANRVRSTIILQVYDEIVTCTHKDDSPAFAAMKQKIMVEAAQRWITTVPIEVEGHVLPYWTK